MTRPHTYAGFSLMVTFSVNVDWLIASLNPEEPLQCIYMSALI